MARFYKLLAISCWLLAASCQEGREAGDLWGQWRMGVDPFTIWNEQIRSEAQYLSFSGNIAWFKANGVEVFGNFQHQGDSLFIQCSSIEGSPIDTITVEQNFDMRPFTNIRLKIEKLNSDDLVLSKDGRTWNFYKY